MAVIAALLGALPLSAHSSPTVRCTLEMNGEATAATIRSEADALGGQWIALDSFKVRATLAAPTGKSPWLLIEVYAKAADDDYRILSSQKIAAPFTSGRMEVVEPNFGRSLFYQCGER